MTSKPDCEEMRAAAFTALLDWHPEFGTMAPQVWEPLVDRMCAAWQAETGEQSFGLFARAWIAREHELDGPPGQPCSCLNVAGDCDGDHMPPGGWTSIGNSTDRHTVWESGADPNDPANYTPEPPDGPQRHDWVSERLCRCGELLKSPNALIAHIEEANAGCQLCRKVGHPLDEPCLP